MEAATLAVVRASRPTFRSAHDKLAFAVHAFLLSEGFKLVAPGVAAEDESADFATSREEVDPAGWDSLDAAYAFRYQDTEGKRAPVYVKGLVLGGQLLVHWVEGDSPTSEPRTLELDAAAFTTDEPAAPACYQHTTELVAKLRQHLGSVLAGGPTAAGSAGRQKEGRAQASGRAEGREAEPLQEQPPGVSGVGYRPPGLPVGIGADDLVPPGVRPPGYGGGPAFPGLMEPGPLRGGGGMHVGPGDPIFGPGRLGGGVGRPPGHGSLPPGARWDPIAPPGMRGFGPDDFQREPGQPHPDMMQPGPGRGRDFDEMFG
ncbi:hypothetical protein CHLNCDRAFT_136975 [Chlorella variabilis]|uniref:Uncharacterized protein n=1 Tax=Chlorella variabilis TaxID=554065 RepID=E1ZLQ2_CHLVA|nr:hypothetical protein CHLNCDRAFT_136975 [Chlorella variabilis]EFN53306.1 hypothetical protein CHLNCDRAFT_136975 [Chlorella variabilis]|eukprot:XP_005845408.1 hypothetical protein CHLNCDRAFT_136975 [Chlorella variabilis]